MVLANTPTQRTYRVPPVISASRIAIIFSSRVDYGRIAIGTTEDSRAMRMCDCMTLAE
jgi:hypothetical protein